MSYKSSLDMYLNKVVVPHETVICRNESCNNPSHLSDIDKLCKDILNCCIRAGLNNIPQSKSASKRIPGWKEHVKPARE